MVQLCSVSNTASPCNTGNKPVSSNSGNVDNGDVCSGWRRLFPQHIAKYHKILIKINVEVLNHLPFGKGDTPTAGKLHWCTKV